MEKSLDEILQEVLENAPSIRGYDLLEQKEYMIWDSRKQQWKIQRRRRRLTKGERGEEEKMREPIEWHERRLKNRISSLNNEKERLRILEGDIARDEEAITKLGLQIERAKKEGRDGFDANQFNIPRQKKYEEDKSHE